MPFLPIRAALPGTIEQAARRIYRILEREDRVSGQERARSGIRPEQRIVPAQMQSVDRLRRSPSGINEQRAEQLDARRRQRSRQTRASTSPVEPAVDYGVDEWLGDKASGVGRKDYENYVGANTAVSEMVGSQMPGRERGPADAYRHILWAAELTRRFGEERARQILDLHEREGDQNGQPQDERAMDRSNNEIGISIGTFARNWPDVVSAARKVISGSAADGSGAWQPLYDANSTLASHGASWLPQNRWAKNPRVDNWKPPIAVRGHIPQAPEMPNSQTNWYTNPNRSNGPDWVAGYLADGYRYPYGLPSHAVGPNDPRLRRAIGAYETQLEWDPYLRWLPGR